MYIDKTLIPLGFFAMVTATTIGLPIARAWARRMERTPPTLPLPPDVTARLERMEQAIDTIAIEVERMSESQRFTTKLLAERGSLGRGGAGGAAPAIAGELDGGTP